MRADRKDIFKSRFQEHYSRLCRIAYGYVSDQDDAEDIVQELFISVWNKRLDDMPEKEFAAYMTTSVRNSCVSFLRKRKEDTVSIDDHPASASCMPDETPEEGKTLQDILDSALEVSVSAILPMNPKNKRLVSFALLISLFPYVGKQFPVFF